MSALGNLYRDDDEDDTEESDNYRNDGHDQQDTYDDGIRVSDNHSHSDSRDSARSGSYRSGENDHHHEGGDEEGGYHHEEEPDSDDSRVKNDGYGSDSGYDKEHTDGYGSNSGYDREHAEGEEGDYGEREEGDYVEGEEGDYGEGEHDDDFYDEADPEKPRDMDRGVMGMSGGQSTMALCCCVICFLLALMIGAIIGAMITDGKSFKEALGIDDSDDSGDTGSGGPSECPPPPIFEPQSTFACLENNLPLEFRITFDSSPGEVGIRVYDAFNTNMWNFPAGSFASFSLLRKENVFSLCLSPDQNYTLEITDSRGNGLVSTLGATIYGSFTVLYANETITTYNGNCDSDSDPAECGDFDICSYLLAPNATSGSCSTTNSTPPASGV